MPLKRSPGGSTFPYPYKGGELFGLHLGSFGSDEDGVLARMSAEQGFFLEQNRRISVWMDFYETRMTRRVVTGLVGFLEATQGLVSKLGLVGCSGFARWRLNGAIKRSALLVSLPVKYFSDPEDAKTWLVSELE